MKHMSMTYRLIIAAVFPLALSAQTAEAQERAEPVNGDHLDFKNGLKVYRSVCAACHDSGKHGAPKLQDDGWAKRSFEWFSVMNKHANQGFLDMPAKGNHPTLTDQEVKDAVFYMMETIDNRK